MNDPVLILGAGLRLTVTIARSLNRQGIPVIVSPISSDEPPIKSRAIQKHVTLPNFRTRPDAFITELKSLIQTEGIDMIIPTGDGAMTAVAQHYETLTNLVHVGSPPPPIMEQVLDKRLTLTAAQKCGVPIATSRTVEASSEIGKLIKGLRFPLIAKPAERKGANTYRIKYFITAEDLFQSITEDTEWLHGGLLQEYIPGVGKGIGVLMHEGKPLTMFQHRRIKEFPYTGGVSVMAEAEAVDPVLGDLAIKLLQEIKWQGIAMVEYRYNPSNNNFALMEINGRYWGSLFLSAQAGIDFPYYEWQLAHGIQPNIPKAYPVGIRARWMAGDILRLHNIFEDSQNNKIEPISRYRELIHFMTDFSFRTHDAVFSLNDPMPAIQEFRETTGALAKADLKSIISKTIPEPLLKQIRIYRLLGPKSRRIFMKQQLNRFLGNQPILFRQSANEINNIMFICLGNIIRSPTAALSLKQKLALTDNRSLEIKSAGLWKGLSRVDPRSSPEAVLKIAPEFGISLTKHRSQPITQELINTSDVIFVMDYQNESMLLSQYPDARHKVFLLGACIEKIPISQWEITDPYGKTADDIRKCFSIINDRIEGLVKILMK
tara:strand:- start:56 stop:1864 length:1809 start_codon:yes stop_codon:yes gene_type:complete